MALSEGRRRRRSTRALLGYLEVHVFEASPRGLKKTMGVQRISSAWKALVPGMSEVLCRVEISGIAAQRAETALSKVGKASILWDTQMRLPVYEGAKELRLLLLAVGKGDAPPKTIANGGFYVEDIMASPSNCKWFELFAPGGSAGGTIKLSILYTAAVPSEECRRHSVNAETQMEADAASEAGTNPPPPKSMDATEAAINTDPITDSCVPPTSRRSITVHIGVGPSPVGSQRSSPTATAVPTKRRASRQRRASAPPEAQPTVDTCQTDTTRTSTPAPLAADVSPVYPIDGQRVRDTSGGPSDESSATASADLESAALRELTSNALPFEVVLQPAAEPVATPGPEDSVDGPGDTGAREAPPIALPVAAILEERVLLEDRGTAPRANRAGGGPPLLLVGITAVAALIGAVVLGSRRNGGKSKSGKAYEQS